MATEMKRTRRLNIRLSEDIVNRLESQAEMRGLAISTIASYAIGEYLVNIEHRANMQHDLTSQLSQQMSQNMTDPQVMSKLMSLFGHEIDKEQIDLPLKSSES